MAAPLLDVQRFECLLAIRAVKKHLSADLLLEFFRIFFFCIFR